MRTKVRLALLAAIAALFVCLVAALSIHGDGDLLDHAIVLADAARFGSLRHAPTPRFGSPGSRVLLAGLRHSDRETEVVWSEYTRVFGTPTAGMLEQTPQLYRDDWTVVTETPFSAPNRALAGDELVEGPIGADQFSRHISPDGRWLLTLAGMRNGPSHFLLTRMDDARQVRGVAPLGRVAAQYAWLPDSSGWVEAALLRGGAVAHQFSVEIGRLVRSWNLAGLTSDWRTVGITPDLRLIVADPPYGPEATLYSCDLRSSSPTAVKLGVVRGPGGGLRAACLSPDGRRIVWTWAAPERPQEGPLDSLLARIGIRPSAPGPAVSVSQADGSPMRVLGRLTYRRGDAGIPPDVQPTWTPDSRRVMFAWGNALYETRAD